MAVFVFHVPLKETDISCNSNFLSLLPSYVNTVHKIKTFPACKFDHVRSPTDFSQWLPIESAKCFCLRMILKWLISLAAPALAGRCIGRMSCGSGPQQTPRLRPASALGQDRCDHKFPHAVLSSLCPEPARSALGFVRVRSRADWGHARGALLLLHGQKPSFVLSLNHMLKLFGKLEWYYISPGSKETFTTSLMNLSQSFNNAAIYRLEYWIDCRSCTKAHSVSAMKLQRDIRADWNHSVWLHTFKYYNLCFAWLDSLLNWKVNGILTHLYNFLKNECFCKVQEFSSHRLRAKPCSCSQDQILGVASLQFNRMPPVVSAEIGHCQKPSQIISCFSFKLLFSGFSKHPGSCGLSMCHEVKILI